MKHLNEIFKLQRELNILIKRDTVGAGEQQRHDWMFGYLFAASAEVNELLECFEPKYLNLVAKENALIEIIDIWHFIVSTCHLIEITPDDISLDNDQTFNEHIFNASFKFSVKLNKIITSNIAFKWWSKDVKLEPSRQFRAIYDVEKLRNDLIELFSDLIKLSHSFGMSDDDVFEIYKMKHRKNIDRQALSYDVRFKTETDNEEIQDQIKTGLVEVAPGQFAPSDRPTCNLTEGMSDDLKMVVGIPIKIKTDGFSGEFRNTIDPSLKQLNPDGGSEGDLNLSEFKQPV